MRCLDTFLSRCHGNRGNAYHFPSSPSVQWPTGKGGWWEESRGVASLPSPSGTVPLLLHKCGKCAGK